MLKSNYGHVSLTILSTYCAIGSGSIFDMHTPQKKEQLAFILSDALKIIK